MKSLRGKTVYFWWTASSCYAVKFVRWCSMRRGCGSKDTNKLDVGAVVQSDWLFGKAIVSKVPHGLRRGQYRLQPYTPIYRTEHDAKRHRRAIRRPERKSVSP